MALINFDCPECGHNLEVDEGGAGFIVKCPECSNPLQIPDLPKSRRFAKTATLAATLVSILVLFAANTYFWREARSLRSQLANELKAFDRFRDEAIALSMHQEKEIARLQDTADSIQPASAPDLADVALDAVEEAERLSRLLEQSTRDLLAQSSKARTELLRAHMEKLVENAKNGLPAQPSIDDLGPGRGIQGRKIVFPVLPGPDGQTIRENAEITAVDDDKVSVKFAGGSATYSLSELHPGVAAFLPVDRLLVLPRRQWPAEVSRLHQLESARRDERIAEIRAAAEKLLPPD